MSPSEFVKHVVKAYESGTGIFANKINAEELVPKGLTDTEKALYLFYVIQLDYATKSQRLYEGALTLHKEIPDFFTPDYILNLSKNELQELLKEYLHPRYINEAIKRYRLNSHKLAEEYESNPLLISSSSETAIEFLKNVRNFRGFGPKIGNFFVRTMINSFDLQYSDIEDILPPVDVHDVRIAYLLGFIESKEMTQKNITEVKSLWSNACKEAKESWLVFDKALWLIGSEGSPKSAKDIYSLLE